MLRTMVDEIVNNPAADLAESHIRPDDRLREAIVTGRFQPSERLVETEVARELGVGRSAVRTALARLEHEGLVEHERHRGARVRLINAREAVEILEVRAVLEGLAARHAAANATPDDIEDLGAILAEMRLRLDAGDLLGASDQNALLHGRILEIAGHTTVARLIATLKYQLVRFQYRTILLPGRSERSFSEHSRIVRAIAAADMEDAGTGHADPPVARGRGTPSGRVSSNHIRGEAE